MWPPFRNGLHPVQQLGPAPEEADAARPAHLVARDRDEVGAERLHVDRAVRRRLRRVADVDRAALVRPGREPPTSLIVPSELETKSGRDDLHVLPKSVELVELELSLVVDRDHPELGAGAWRDVLPGDEIRVVLELGCQHDVARAEVREPPCIGDEVDRLGRVADEDDLARGRRVDERARLLARALESGGRALAELVDAAMHVRV